MERRVALITGAGRGIGRATALALGGEGLELCLVARSADQLEETAAECRAAGAGEVVTIPADLTEGAVLDRLVSALEDGWGRLDVLVQNAARFEANPLQAGDDRVWERTFELNAAVPYRLLRRCVPLLKAAGGGHVFHIVSVAATTAFAGYSAYCASKAALLALNNVARAELRAEGTKVTAVLPGAVDTEVWDGVEGDFDRAKMLHPEDVARAVVCAWRDDAGAMTEEIVLRPQGGDL